jgi:hypothetical protein
MNAERWGAPSHRKRSNPEEVELLPVQVENYLNSEELSSVRLDTDDRLLLEQTAKAKTIGPSALARMWIKERFHQEAAAASSSRGVENQNFGKER